MCVCAVYMCVCVSCCERMKVCLCAYVCGICIFVCVFVCVFVCAVFVYVLYVYICICLLWCVFVCVCVCVWRTLNYNLFNFFHCVIRVCIVLLLLE